jgi:hypothetical protein
LAPFFIIPAKVKIMEKVEVVATSHFTDTRIGGVSRKQRLYIPAHIAAELHSIGLVEYPNGQATATKNPLIAALADGGGVLPVLLPVAQALPPKTVIQYPRQGGQPSPSMTVTEEPCLPMSSMPATNSGGESMKKKRGRPSKANAGHKITAHPKIMESTE